LAPVAAAESYADRFLFCVVVSWCPPGGFASRSYARWYDGCGACAEAYDKKPAPRRDLDAAWQRERWWSVVMCAANEPCCRCTCGWVSCCCAPRPCCRPAELPRLPRTSTANEVCVHCTYIVILLSSRQTFDNIRAVVFVRPRARATVWLSGPDFEFSWPGWYKPS